MSNGTLTKISELLGENDQFSKIVSNIYLKNKSNRQKFVDSCLLLKKKLDIDALGQLFQILSKEKRPEKKRVLLDLDWEDEDEKVNEEEAGLPIQSNDSDPDEESPKLKTGSIKFKKLKKSEAQRLKSFHDDGEEQVDMHKTLFSQPQRSAKEERSSENLNNPSRKSFWSSINKEDLVSVDSNSDITLINSINGESNIEAPENDITDVEDDREWYGVEEYYGGFNDEELEVQTQAQINRHNREQLFKQRNKQKSKANDRWIKNQLDKSLGKGHLLNLGDDDDFEDDDYEELLRFNIAVDRLVPPFLKDEKVELTGQKTLVNPVRDPEGDLAMMAIKGSFLVKEKRHENEKLKHDEEHLSDTKLGKVMGVKSGDKSEDENEENDADDDNENEDGDEGVNIYDQKRSLPVFSVKDQLMKQIMENQVLVIVGETGSGKTTQIPQYLRDAGLNSRGMIAVTQPRRVAAMSVAKRVSEEVGCPLGDQVGYSIRFEDKTSEKTQIKFMTDGILLRECLMDDSLEKYSCVIIDEAHERALNTDILLGLFKSILAKRRDLKLLITSATMNAEKFSTFFGNAPQFNIPGRTFPVDILSNLHNVTDYVESCVQQVLKIHSQSQTSGDILCFMTGQEDIEVCCQVLNEKLKEFEHLEPLKVLPIYSTLPTDLQNKIFKKSKFRKCIVATNIAETSLTVDGIKFVIDCGLSKLKIYNPKLNMDALQVCPISVAQLNQRSGRAGRTGPGVCYRLYTLTQQQEEMYPQPIPEIQRTNLSNTLLLLKNLGIKDLTRFPFMDSPPMGLITSSLYELWILGALDNFGDLTELGKMMSKFPLEPSLSKFLIKSIEFNCSSEVITIVAMLSVPQIFVRSKERQQESDQARLKFQILESDHLTLLNVFNLFMKNANVKWCTKNFLNFKSLRRANDIRQQIITIFNKLKIPVHSSGYNNDDVVLKCLCSTFYLNALKFEKFGSFINMKNGLSVFLHPTSALYSMNDFPSHVIYHEILLTSKEYMNYVSVVRPEWLLEFGANLYTLKNEVESYDDSRHLDFVEKLNEDHTRYNDQLQTKQISKKVPNLETKPIMKFRRRRGF